MAAIGFSDWFRTFSLANRLFLDNQIEHVFIKILLNPFQMVDVDVLIPNVSEERRALELLRKEGFRPYRAGRLLHPWKMICDGKYVKHICVDIYPDAEWNRTKVGDGKEIVSRRVLSKVGGVKAYVPIPEDSFYLIATHAYFQHLRITRAEVLNVISLASAPNFSWKRIYALTKKFETFDPIYAFLRAINLERPNTINEKVLNTFSHASTKFVDRLFMNVKKSEFPFRVPIWLGCIIPSFTHTQALVGEVKAGELVFDFISHYMRLVGRK